MPFSLSFQLQTTAPEAMGESRETGVTGTSGTPVDGVEVLETAEADPTTPNKKRKKSALSSLFGNTFKVADSQHNVKSVLALAKDEVTKYMAEPGLDIDANPLLWWKENTIFFPLLSSLVTRYLCIPGTSVPSERVFSTAGDIVTAQRSTLKGKHVDMLIFLKKNF